mmetsp:Transcript_31795/g.94499  ORF Transcript_31795/g.94499 Transcript_31795/m.94499 type:complete len:669 (+) Transcript_31795:821-2827(+)
MLDRPSGLPLEHELLRVVRVGPLAGGRAGQQLLPLAELLQPQRLIRLLLGRPHDVRDVDSQEGAGVKPDVEDLLVGLHVHGGDLAARLAALNGHLAEEVVGLQRRHGPEDDRGVRVGAHHQWVLREVLHAPDGGAVVDGLRLGVAYLLHELRAVPGDLAVLRGCRDDALAVVAHLEDRAPRGEVDPLQHDGPDRVVVVVDHDELLCSRERHDLLGDALDLRDLAEVRCQRLELGAARVVDHLEMAVVRADEEAALAEAQGDSGDRALGEVVVHREQLPRQGAPDVDVVLDRRDDLDPRLVEGDGVDRPVRREVRVDAVAVEDHHAAAGDQDAIGPQRADRAGVERLQLAIPLGDLVRGAPALHADEAAQVPVLHRAVRVDGQELVLRGGHVADTDEAAVVILDHVRHDAGARVPDADEAVEAPAEQHVVLRAEGQEGDALLVIREDVHSLLQDDIVDDHLAVQGGRRQGHHVGHPAKGLEGLRVTRHRGQVVRLVRLQGALDGPHRQGVVDAPGSELLREVLRGVQDADLVAPAQLADDRIEGPLLDQEEGGVPEADRLVVRRGDHPLVRLRHEDRSKHFAVVPLALFLAVHVVGPVKLEAELALLEDDHRVGRVIGEVEELVEVALGDGGPERGDDVRLVELEGLPALLRRLQSELLRDGADELDEL